MKKLLLLLCLASILSAKTIIGIGYSDNELEAKEFALADISSQISTEVLSEFSSITNSFNGDLQTIKESVVKTKSELPILGVEFSYKKIKI